jgi:LacI family transcriptional regulator
MTATMMDIAKDVNVSVVTVSKVLRNQGRISEATRKRVLRRAKELNYQMNWAARSLVTRRTYTLGLPRRGSHRSPSRVPRINFFL